MSTEAKLRGDVCPAWCGGQHDVQRTQSNGQPLHPEDQGVMHHSALVAKWHPRHGYDTVADDAIEVRVEGKRHDLAEVDGEEQDWPDMVYATNTEPGFVCAVGLQVPEARRLGEALIAAADLAQGKA